MKIEISNQDLEILAELAFLGEHIINGERGDKQIPKYNRVKEQILNAYRSMLNQEDKEYLEDEENEDEHYMGLVYQHLILYETALAIYSVSEKISKIFEESELDVCDKIAKWKKNSKDFLEQLY